MYIELATFIKVLITGLKIKFKKTSFLICEFRNSIYLCTRLGKEVIEKFIENIEIDSVN
jgi:hypothetical protein